MTAEHGNEEGEAMDRMDIWRKSMPREETESADGLGRSVPGVLEKGECQCGWS